MERLIQNGLKYGNLVLLRSKHLVERYNRALELLIGKTTTLKEFHIDITGYSPEIAKEFDDKTYLNPFGSNKLFILVTLDQADKPSLDEWVSSTRTMMNEFIENNKNELFALTSKDVVYGVIENDTYKINTIGDLMRIKQVTFKCDTPTKIIKKAEQLEQKIHHFKYSSDMWCNDDDINEIIELVNATGDIRRNSIEPQHVVFNERSFFSKHFGGVYVFYDSETTVIALDSSIKEQVLEYNEYINFISIDETEKVFNFLIQYQMVDYISDSNYHENVDKLDDILTLSLVDCILKNNTDKSINDINLDNLQKYIYEYYDDLPEIYHATTKIIKYAKDQHVDNDVINTNCLFYFVIPSGQYDNELINHLLVHYTPYNYLNTFITNKDLFYQRYNTWSDDKKDYVVQYLVDHYSDIKGN